MKTTCRCCRDKSEGRGRHPALKGQPDAPSMTCASEGVMEELENPNTQTENYRMAVMQMWRANMEDNT